MIFKQIVILSFAVHATSQSSMVGGNSSTSETILRWELIYWSWIVFTSVLYCYEISFCRKITNHLSNICTHPFLHLARTCRQPIKVQAEGGSCAEAATAGKLKCKNIIDSSHSKVSCGRPYCCADSKAKFEPSLNVKDVPVFRPCTWAGKKDLRGVDGLPETCPVKCGVCTPSTLDE